MNSFLPRAVALWNKLPVDIQQSSSTFIFKKRLRTHLKTLSMHFTNFQLSLSLSLFVFSFKTDNFPDFLFYFLSLKYPGFLPLTLSPQERR